MLTQSTSQKPKAKPAKKAAPKQTQKKAAAKPAAKGKKKAKADSENDMSDQDDPFGEDSALSQTPPKKTKAAAGTKGNPNKKPLGNADEREAPKRTKSEAERSVMEKYRHVSSLQRYQLKSNVIK